MHNLGRATQYACVGFLIGVCVAGFVAIQPLYLIIGAAVFACLGICSRPLWIRRISVFAVSLSIGAICLQARSSQSVWLQYVGQSYQGIAVVTSEQEEYGRFNSFSARPDGFSNNIKVSFIGTTEVTYGATIFLSGVVSHSQGRFIELRAQRVLVLSRKCNLSSCWYMQPLVSLRNMTKKQLVQNVGELGTVAYSLLFGGSSGINPDIIQVFRVTGLSHVLAVSGYNISIILTALVFIRRSWGKRALVILSVTLVIYCALSGFSASVVRATCMGVVYLIGAGIGRMYLAGHALLLAACVMVFVSPEIILFNPSFQFSFIASAGIILLAPVVLSGLWCIPKKLKKLKLQIATSLSAVLATIPLQIYLFSGFSLIAVPANLVMFMVIPLLMLLALLSSLPFIGVWFGYLFSELFALCVWVLHLFGQIPNAYLPISISSYLTLVAYILLLLFWLLHKDSSDESNTPTV
ncbi:MAG TPA: ComEC/Rec2 family competence protein [Patescibacteria group bacterium]|nr:ComEC/Rec2 family competence protein [Patescibacteria group bacterium]